MTGYTQPMQSVRPGVFDSAGRMREAAQTAVYVIAADLGGDDIAAKIGMTAIPYERYCTLLSGIPFPSIMKWSWAGDRWQAVNIERNLHNRFVMRNTAREWYRFATRDKAEIWGAIREEFEAVAGRAPEWQVITEAQAAAFRTETKKKVSSRRAA